MPFPANLSKRLRSLLFGDPFGEVFPARAPPPPATQSVDGRTHALRVLRDYVCELVFYLPMEEGCPPKPFQLLPENFLIDPPGSSHEWKFPSIAVQQVADGDYNAIGLTSYVEEETRDVYAPGTVVQWQDEYEEKFHLEVSGSQAPEVRSIIAGLETAISPTEQMSGLRFRMPDYFDQLVCFTLNRRNVGGDADSTRGRRVAKLELAMRFNIVALVNSNALTVETELAVGFDPDTGLPLDLSTPRDPELAGSRPLPPYGTVYVPPADASDLSQAPRWPRTRGGAG